MNRQKTILTGRGVRLLILSLILIVFGVNSINAQNRKHFEDKRHKGRYTPRKNTGRGGKHGKYKSYRQSNKKSYNRKHRSRKVKNYKKNARQKHARNKYRSKSHKKLAKRLKSGKALYNTKRRGKNRRRKGSYKGRYPRNKRELGSKIMIGGLLGGVITQQDNSGLIGDPSAQLFANYKPGPEIGFLATYNLTDNFAMEGDMRFIPLSKDNYAIRAMSVGFNLKYTFKSYSKFKPYVFGGLNYSFSNIKQDPFTSEPWNPPVEYWQESQENIEVTEVIYREPGLALNLIPMIGYKFGVGTDYEINDQLNLFGSIEYNTSFAKNKGVILEHFPLNKSDFSYLSFTVGVRYKLFKSQSLY